MLELFTKRWKLEGVILSEIAQRSDGLSGAHMYDLCRTAAELAIEVGSVTEGGQAVVTKAHFQRALREVKNKDYSTYMKVAGKKSGMGFAGELQRSIDEEW